MPSRRQPIGARALRPDLVVGWASGNAPREIARLRALGVQIVRVYGQLKTAQQEESVLSQQLTQQQQENDALRSDLAKKDDESFIKALARDLLGLAEEGERIFYDVND